MYCVNCWHTIEAPDSQFCPTCGVNLLDWARATTSSPPAGAAMANNAIVLNQSPITLGRGAQNDIQLAHPAVSEQHARLEWRPEAEAWFVVDEASAKGTFINYAQVPQGVEGQPINATSDVLWIAPYAFRLVDGEQQQSHFEPAHLRLDAIELLRTVKLAGKKEPTHILNLQPTPLSFRPGEFIALVGGSGAGKSTLMKALLGLDVAQQGTVFVSGRPFIQNGRTQRFAAMQAIVGYVPQDDVMHRELTPLEALDTVARLRLSPDLSRDERLAAIQETLETVELWPHRHKLIRQLSGGQRKRVNIALELLAQPRLLFLDEPTSGLDPGLDLAVMELLRTWATNPDDPRTIILVTHATENVTSCKYVAFMAAGGYVVYFGPPAKALDYFGVTRFAEIYRQVGQYHLPDLVSPDNNQAADSAPPDVHELVERFSASPDYFQYVTARQLPEHEVRAATDADEAETDSDRWRPFSAATRERFWQQLGILTARYWKLLRRDRMNFIVLLLQGLLVAGLLWAVARPDTFQPRGAENAQTVLFIMACAAVWLGILNGTKEIVKEQDIYAREQRYGLNAAAYVLSKLLLLGAVGAFQMGTLLLIIGYQIPFPARGALGAWSPAWLEWFITLELTLVAGLALGLFLSAMSKSVDAATAVMFVLLLIQVMFAGLFFEDASWADSLSVITFSRWGLEGVGTTANLNGLLQQAMGSSFRPDQAYSFTAVHLLIRWAILSGFIGFLTTATSWRQAKK